MRTPAVLAALLAAPLMFATVSAADAPMKPGDRITVDHGDGKASICTLGPLVDLPDGQQAVVTSGHCGENGNRVSFDGTELASSVERRVDQQIDGILHDYSVIPVPRGSVLPIIGGRYPQDGFLRMEEVDVLSKQPGGLQLCSVGIKSGERCGPVVSVNYNRGEIVADFDTIKGDSGGPVFVKVNESTALVVGIVMGYRTDATKDTVIIPLDYMINTYNLTVAR